MQELKLLAENFWEISRPLRAPGLRVGHRMTVVRLRTGELWVHSPVNFEEALANELKALGAVRHFIAPSRFHDLYWPEWFAHFPEATFYCAAGLKEEHPCLKFQSVLNESAPDVWEEELPKLLVCGMPKLNEFVFLHRASRTLIVTDLLFNFDVSQQNPFGKLFLKLNGTYGRPACSRIFRRFIKDRAAFKSSIIRILDLDFDRVVLSHGAIVERNGKTALRQAFDWLLRP